MCKVFFFRLVDSWIPDPTFIIRLIFDVKNEEKEMFILPRTGTVSLRHRKPLVTVNPVRLVYFYLKRMDYFTNVLTNYLQVN